MKTKSKTFNCGCGSPYCGKVKFIKYDKILDVGFIPYKCKKVKYGVIIRDNNLFKLFNFLKEKIWRKKS